MTVTEVFYREEPVYHEEHEKHEGDKKRNLMSCRIELFLMSECSKM